MPGGRQRRVFAVSSPPWASAESPVAAVSDLAAGKDQSPGREMGRDVPQSRLRLPRALTTSGTPRRFSGALHPTFRHRHFVWCRGDDCKDGLCVKRHVRGARHCQTVEHGLGGDPDPIPTLHAQASRSDRQAYGPTHPSTTQVGGGIPDRDRRRPRPRVLRARSGVRGRAGQGTSGSLGSPRWNGARHATDGFRLRGAGTREVRCLGTGCIMIR